MRNNTSIFQKMADWRAQIQRDYANTPVIEPILSQFQYALCKYMAGAYMDFALPRGVLLYWKQGSGKTKGFVAAALYVLATRADVYKKGIAVVVINKALQANVMQELRIYVDQLNQAGIGLDFATNNGNPIDFKEAQKSIKFITYNDTRNFQKNIHAQFDTIAGYTQKFVIMDEAHNLFRSAINSLGLEQQQENAQSRGHQLYDMLMGYKDLQIVFASGTPIINEPVELSVCFQMLTMNPTILDPTYFNEMFVNVKEMHQNRDILTRRLYGLVQYVELDEQSDLPQLLPLVVKDIKLSAALEGRYVLEKRKEARRDFFMQASRQASNCMRVKQQGQQVVLSDKFAAIKEAVETSGRVNHMVFSNFVENGCEALALFCLQKSDSQVKWEQVVVDQSKGVCVKGSSQQLSPRGNTCRIALIHSNVPVEERVLIIEEFNKDRNANGDYINLIVLSPASTEGINLFCVRYVHVVEPLWSWNLADQVIYRAVRRGSHKNLPEDQRTVQPILYLAYNIEPYNGTDFKQRAVQRSTDQHIYIQSHSKFKLTLQFLQTLSACAFNCNDYYKIASKKVKQFFGLPIQDEQVCFSCLPTNQQLFDPTSVYKDFIVNNCSRIESESPDQTIKLGSLSYKWVFDVFATYGVRFFEARDRSRNYINEDTDAFRELLQNFHLLYNNPAQENQLAEPLQKQAPATPDTHIEVNVHSELRETDNIIINAFIDHNLVQLSDLIQSPAVQTIKLSDSEELHISSIYVKANAIPLLLQYFDNIRSSVSQVIEVVAEIGQTVISKELLIQYIQKHRTHTLHRFVKTAEDPQQLKKLNYFFREVETDWKTLCQKIGELVIQKLSSTSLFNNVLIAIRRETQSNQFALRVPQQLSYLDKAILFVCLQSIMRSEQMNQEVSYTHKSKTRTAEAFDNRSLDILPATSDLFFPIILSNLMRQEGLAKRRVLIPEHLYNLKYMLKKTGNLKANTIRLMPLHKQVIQIHSANQEPLSDYLAVRSFSNADHAEHVSALRRRGYSIVQNYSNGIGYNVSIMSSAPYSQEGAR